MMVEVNQTYCDHFSTHTNIEYFCCTPEKGLYVNYTLIFLKKEKEDNIFKCQLKAKILNDHGNTALLRRRI